MKLSHHAWSVLVVGLALFAAPCRSLCEDIRQELQVEAVPAPLAHRIHKLLPRLLRSLSEARRVGDVQLIRCFDRAVAALHGVERQLHFHAVQGSYARRPEERLRHQRAMDLLAQRVDELARSGETCFTDGTLVRSGETFVEVVFESP